MSDLEQLLKTKVGEINASKEKLKKVDAWIDGYRGKVISVKSGGDAYHLVFTKGKASFRKGESPSSDLTYVGDAESIAAILRGETITRAEIRKGKIHTWQNLHESIRLEEVLST